MFDFSICEEAVEGLKQNTLPLIMHVDAPIDPAVMKDFTDALKTNTSIEAMHIVVDDLTPYVTDLADAIKANTSLQAISIIGSLKPDDMVKLSEAIEQNTSITSVDFSRNEFGITGARALGKAIRNNHNLRALELNATTSIDDKQMQAIAGGIKANPNFTYLEKSGEKIDAASGLVYADLIENVPHLGGINLRAKDIEPLAAGAINTALSKNQALVSVTVDAGNFAQAEYHAFADALLASKNPNLLEASYLHQPLMFHVSENMSESQFVWFHMLEGDFAMAAPFLRSFEKRPKAVEQLGVSMFGMPREYAKDFCEKLQQFITDLPSVDFSQPVTLDSLTTKNDKGLTPLDNPHTWDQMAQVTAALQKSGTPLTKDFLAKPSRTEQSYMQIGIWCEALPVLMKALNANGERIGKAELIDDEGKPTDLLQGAMQTGTVNSFFTTENWKGAPPHAPRQLYDALPQKAQDQVNNMHALTNELRRNQLSSQRNR